MSWRPIIASAVTLIVLVVLSLICSATKATTISGTVISVGRGAVNLDTASETVHVVLSSAVKYQAASNLVGPEDLVRGAKISISGDWLGLTTLQAKVITIIK